MKVKHRFACGKAVNFFKVEVQFSLFCFFFINFITKRPLCCTLTVLFQSRGQRPER
jgi:hypothetical protein